MPVKSKALTDGKIVLWHTKDPDSMVLVFEPWENTDTNHSNHP